MNSIDRVSVIRLLLVALAILLITVAPKAINAPMAVSGLALPAFLHNLVFDLDVANSESLSARSADLRGTIVLESSDYGRGLNK